MEPVNSSYNIHYTITNTLRRLRDFVKYTKQHYEKSCSTDLPVMAKQFVYIIILILLETE